MCSKKMKYLLVVCLLLGTSVVHAGQAAEYVNSYFELWFKDHHFTDFEKGKKGLVFPKKRVLLDGEIYEAKELQPGKLYSVESRISVTFKNGRRLDDFVAGVGGSVEEAFYDSLQNFCLTTLHPIYAELFDHNDTHVRKETWSVNGVQRRIFLSGWGQRGESVDEATQTQVERLIAEELKGLPVSGDIHWVKLVVSAIDGKLDTLVVTIDGIQNDAMTRRLGEYGWPMPSGFYVAKLFLVIGET